MKSLFNTEAFHEINSRLQNLTEDSQKHWGKMTAGQMLNHCRGPLNIVLEKNTYGLKPNWFAKTFFKGSMYNDKPWRKNMPTLKQFRQTEARDFKEEKKALQAMLEEFDTQRSREEWPDHPAFGAMTKEQWGKMQYKHLDHHFRQFGV
ncbi:DUF1569 domain-containing protein [Rasiella rasia]|uniref:DUF1569 domain-containing protein n=1 Tax=Rasiella rasia TaxID=2744027 RepID=A0A6G6GKX7_9FLAO|nr:DUF1569 domain-containing protein [Rasiella rasia]QIE59246.1 DUF1569 domain-containing protein [Rasiella rasia]